MTITDYYSEDADGIQFSRQQSSDFAKQVAGDFNPIHNPDSKRFCVPGDLLFAVVLSRYGLCEQMHFNFSGLLADGIPLRFPDTDAEEVSIRDQRGKEYLNFSRRGNCSTDSELIRELTRSYVAFSGHNFQQVLVPLMLDNNVMINPDRPLVIYESMSVKLDRFDVTNPDLVMEKSTLDVEGKRGQVRLEFRLTAPQGDFGHGEKSMILSGLRPADPEVLQALLDGYIASKEAYFDSE
ncbi:MAG: DUF3581 family protein [Gammaproteobacteria bacterium]